MLHLQHTYHVSFYFYQYFCLKGGTTIGVGGLSLAVLSLTSRSQPVWIWTCVECTKRRCQSSILKKALINFYQTTRHHFSECNALYHLPQKLFICDRNEIGGFIKDEKLFDRCSKPPFTSSPWSELLWALLAISIHQLDITVCIICNCYVKLIFIL
jgi:hypothetical protein